MALRACHDERTDRSHFCDRQGSITLVATRRNALATTMLLDRLSDSDELGMLAEQGRRDVVIH